MIVDVSIQSNKNVERHTLALVLLRSVKVHAPEILLAIRWLEKEPMHLSCACERFMHAPFCPSHPQKNPLTRRYVTVHSILLGNCSSLRAHHNNNWQSHEYNSFHLKHTNFDVPFNFYFVFCFISFFTRHLKRFIVSKI